MTRINFLGRAPRFGELAALASGLIVAERWRGDAPASMIQGDTYIPDTLARTRIVDGLPEVPLELEPTAGSYCIRWTIVAEGADHSGTPLVLFTSVPPAGPVDFGDLPIVDPKTFLPLEATPASVQELLAQAETAAHTAINKADEMHAELLLAQIARGEAVDASGKALQAREGLDTARAVAEAAATAADLSARDASEHRTAASTSAVNAGESAAAALGHANDSDSSRQLSAGAADASSTAAAAAELSRAQALQLLEQMEALRNAPDGYLVLDPQGLIPASRLPLGAMTFQGVWNAGTNTPTLSNATGKRGQVYAVTGAGDCNLGSGTIDFLVGDQLVHDGTRWHKIDNTDQVLDVNGRRGSIVLVKADVGLGNVDNTPDAEKPVSSAQRAELNKTVTGGSIVGDNLVLTLAGGGQVSAGNVRGPKGDTGDIGDAAPSNTGSWSGAVNLSEPSPVTRIRTLSGNVTIDSLASGASGKSYTVTYTLKQAASGGPFTVTFPANITWSGPQGTPAPTMPTQAGAELVVHLFWTGQRWHGILAGVFLA